MNVSEKDEKGRKQTIGQVDVYSAVVYLLESFASCVVTCLLLSSMRFKCTQWCNHKVTLEETRFTLSQELEHWKLFLNEKYSQAVIFHFCGSRSKSYKTG